MPPFSTVMLLQPIRASGLDLDPVHGELLFTQRRAVDKGHDNVISIGIGGCQRGALKDECLYRMKNFGEVSLRRALGEYVAHLS